MAGPDLPSKALPKFISSDTTVSMTDLVRTNCLMVDTSSPVSVTIPDPSVTLNGWEIFIINTGSHACHVECVDGFAGDRDGMVLLGGRSSHLMCQKNSSAAYEWHRLAPAHPDEEWQDWSMTLTWSGSPASEDVTTYGKYLIKDGLCFLEGYVWSDDADGSTSLTISLPTTTEELDVRVPMAGYKSIDGTVSAALPYIDLEASLNENRVLKFGSFGTWTADKTCYAYISGWYPLGDLGNWVEWTDSQTWDAAIPAGATTVNKYKIVNGMVFSILHVSDDDGQGQNFESVNAPLIPPDQDGYWPVLSLQYDAEPNWTDILAYIDGAEADGADRLIKADNMTDWTNTQAGWLTMAILQELGSSWTAYNSPTITWSDGPPTTITTKTRYYVSGNLCIWQGYVAATDGAGVTGATIKPPVPPKKLSNDIAACAYQKGYPVSSITHINPLAQLSATEDAISSRLLEFADFDTVKTGNALALRWLVIYPIDG